MLRVTICRLHFNSTSKPSHRQHWEGARPFPTTVWWAPYSSTTSLSPIPHAQARWVTVLCPSPLGGHHQHRQTHHHYYLLGLTCAAGELSADTLLSVLAWRHMETSHVQQGIWKRRPVLSMLTWRHMCSKGHENGDLCCSCSLGVQRGTWECRPVLSMLAWRHTYSEGLENAVLYCPCSLGVTRTARDSRMQSCIVHACLASHAQQGTWEYRPVLSMLAWRHTHSKGLENADLYCPQELSPSRHQQIRHLLKNVESGSCVFQCHTNLSV